MIWSDLIWYWLSLYVLCFFFVLSSFFLLLLSPISYFSPIFFINFTLSVCTSPFLSSLFSFSPLLSQLDFCISLLYSSLLCCSLFIYFAIDFFPFYSLLLSSHILSSHSSSFLFSLIPIPLLSHLLAFFSPLVLSYTPSLPFPIFSPLSYFPGLPLISSLLLPSHPFLSSPLLLSHSPCYLLLLSLLM